MFDHEFTKWGAAIFFILGISFASISPNSECSNFFFILISSFLLFSSIDFNILEETNSFISFSITLPILSLPVTSFTLTPNSLANFLSLGLAKTFILFFCLLSVTL